ncbi:hypothetical protein RsoM2USA_280 [Ralstonia phage RsoM2USA]|nr:hypothetical protein RsoM2USA_280 [Ralstonia phage RsoM2USA]
MKLNEIAKSNAFDGIRTEFIYVMPNGAYAKELTLDEFLEEAADDNTGNCTASFSGNGEVLRLPDGIRYLYELNVDRLTINDYTNLPITDIFSVDKCNLGDGFAEYIKNKIAKQVGVTNSLLRIGDVIELAFLPVIDFTYYVNIDGDWLRIVSDIKHKCRVSYQGPSAYDNGIQYFDDEFDAQEWLIDNVDTSEWFK